jgi:excisionase family DNA binding protein
MAASTSPLFVRLPSGEAEKLDRAAFELKTSKGKLVAGLVARYIDPTDEGSMESLRALQTDDRPVVGRAYVRPRDDGDVLTAAEAAQLLRVGEGTVRELAARGDLPGRKLGRQWRFSRLALLEWLGAGGAERSRAGFR